MNNRLRLGKNFLVCGFFTLFAVAARPAAADMDLNIDKLSSNGMEVRKLSCKIESGGLLGSMLIIAELAKHKDGFDKCSSGPAAFATEFTWKRNKPTAARVTASSEAKANACVMAEMKKTQAAVIGTCTAMILVGDKAKAEAKAEELAKK